jgi:hypothetical protein
MGGRGRTDDDDEDDANATSSSWSSSSSSSSSNDVSERERERETESSTQGILVMHEEALTGHMEAGAGAGGQLGGGGLSSESAGFEPFTLHQREREEEEGGGGGLGMESEELLLSSAPSASLSLLRNPKKDSRAEGREGGGGGRGDEGAEEEIAMQFPETEKLRKAVRVAVPRSQHRFFACSLQCSRFDSIHVIIIKTQSLLSCRRHRCRPRPQRTVCWWFVCIVTVDRLQAAKGRAKAQYKLALLYSFGRGG